MTPGIESPFSPLAAYLGSVPLPPIYWLLLVLTLVCYLGLTQIVKVCAVAKIMACSVEQTALAYFHADLAR